ncbi:hypothetical protein BJV82DRAFT_589015 [Fennellomyces sp. T-0311]|nr:hypothetical protein BJV82DRAFT_589015 [Fennellomyces sp. T-0311]
MTLNGKCGDGTEITHEYKGQQAVYQSSESARLKQILQKYRGDISTALYRRLFEAKMARITTQAYIDDTLWSLQSRPRLRGQVQAADTNADLVVIRRLLHSLFAAERLYSSSVPTHDDIESEEVSAFIKDVRTWVMHVSAAYLRLAPLHDRKILLLHLLQSAGTTQWAVSLIQYVYRAEEHPWATFMDEYIVVLYVLFDHSLHRQAPQWNEDDFLAALDQLSIVHVFDALASAVLRQHSGKREIQSLFAFADQLITVLNIGIRTFADQQYANAMKRLAQVMSKIAQVLTHRVCARDQFKGEGQQYLDEFLFRVVDGYLQIQEAKVWHFIPALPFHAVSIQALWKIALLLLDIEDCAEPQDLQHSLDNLPDISKILTFLAENQIQGVFLLGCLSNVITSIPVAADHSQDKDRELAACLIAIVAYTLFTTAFVDDNLRAIYYKDVRDSFGSICTFQPFTMSLLLRWTVAHFDTMEGMAVYLFRSLPLQRWKVLQSDLVLLHELLAEGAVGSVKATFARYVIEHLNYGYDEREDPTVSSSQPWHLRKMPFLPYAIHEELAFMLLDVLQLQNPLPDSDKNAPLIQAVGASVSTYLPAKTQKLLSNAAARMTASNSTTTEAHNTIAEWSWKIALQLKLYDCGLSERATEVEKSISGPFLKDMLHGHTDATASHGALVVYTSFLLSATSRHFLRFESGNGWDKLLLIMRRGRPEAAVQILSDIIPTFVYMHGDDFFNDENVFNFLRQMVDFKADPMLVHSVATWHHSTKSSNDTLFSTDMSGIGLMIGSHVWHGIFIDSVDEIAGGGFSYGDLILHSWMKTVFRKKDWMWSDHYVAVMDCICKIAFCLKRHKLVRSMFSEEQKKLQHHRHQPMSPKLGPVSNQQRNPLRLIKSMLPDAAYASLLAGEWSLASVTTNNLFRTPGVEQDSLWFAYDVLTLETVEEEDLRTLVAEICASTQDLPDMDIVSVLKSHDKRIDKPIDFFTIYRWLQHVLICPTDHTLMPLFLQMFFSLYYANIEKDGRRVFYGHLFFAKKQDMIEKLRDRIAYLQTFHGQQQTDSRDSISVKSSTSGGESEKQRSRHHEDLRRVYYAMWLWLDNADLLDSTYDMTRLPKHYCPELLQSCRRISKVDEKSKPWQDTQFLWLDLVQYDQLSNKFMAYPWVGSDKFRSVEEKPKEYQNVKQNPVYTLEALPLPDLQLTKPAQILSTTELLASTPEALMRSTTETLCQHAKRFHEYLEKQRAVDTQYTEALKVLYVNKSGSKHVEAPCSKESSCKKPAEWDIVASYVKKDDKVEQQLKENRKEAGQMLFRSVDARICIQAMLTFRKFDAIVDQAKQAKRQSSALVQLAWSCLQYVLKNLSPEMRLFPPMRIIILHMCQNLGDAVEIDAQYVDKFFELADDDDDNGDRWIQLIYPAFKPHSDNKRLLMTLERVLRYSSKAQMYLLPSFDMAVWSKSSYASETARNNYYNLMFGHLKAPIVQSEEVLYTQYCDMILSLMESSLKLKKPDFVKVTEHVLKLLGDSKQHNSANGRPAVVDALTARISNSNGIDGDNIVAIVTFLGNSFSEGSSLFATYTNSIPALCRLLQSLFNDARFVRNQKDVPAFICRQLRQCFHSWWRNADDRSQENQYVDVLAESYQEVIQHALEHLDAPGRARLLNWVFGYYHERFLQLSRDIENEWIQYYGNIVANLNWSYLDLSSSHLRRIHQTWSSLRQQDIQQPRRAIYLKFIWKIFSSWMGVHTRPTVSKQQRYDYVEVAFIFVQDGELVWPENDDNRKKSLEQLWSNFSRDNGSLSADQVGSVVSQLRRNWNSPLPLPSAASNDTFLSHCIDWVRRLTGFNEKEASMKRRRLFADYILKLLPDDIDMRRAWTNHIYQVINEHVSSEPHGQDFEETVAAVSNILPFVTEIPPGGSTCMLLADFGALARSTSTATPDIIELMEHVLEQYIISVAGAPDWCRLGELLSRSNPDYSLFLQYCLDQSAFLTLRVYGEAKLQQDCARQDPVKLANLAEEVAAIISIAKVDRKAAVYLVRFFATLFCQSRQQESRLVASIVSLSRTANRWVHVHQHSPRPDLGLDWQVFATLLDGFLASRLIAQGVLSPAPTSSNWIKRLETMRGDKKYKAFTDTINKGIDITQDSHRWTIWQLDQVVTEFAQPLWT